MLDITLPLATVRYSKQLMVLNEINLCLSRLGLPVYQKKKNTTSGDVMNYVTHVIKKMKQLQHE